MLPTPSTSHVCFDTIYEPAEDSYLLLDTLSSSSEATWLTRRFASSTKRPVAAPVVVEVGTGSGVVLAFVAANARSIFGRADILTLGTDVNVNACSAAQSTVRVALDEKQNEATSRKPHDSAGGGDDDQEQGRAKLLAAIAGDLCTPIRRGTVDVLIFNPPYVPTSELPHPPSSEDDYDHTPQNSNGPPSKFERDSHLLSLSYAGGERGMETTDRLLDSIPEILNADRGVAYILLCAQNKPDEVMARLSSWRSGWNVAVVGRSGKTAGWERLVVIRVWKDADTEIQV